LVHQNQILFLELQGIDLMLITIKQKGFFKKSAIKVIDYALMKFPKACSYFVDKLGLKTLFASFIKKSKKTQKNSQDDDKLEEHIQSCIVSLFRNLKGEETGRLLNKFLENELEKVDRLVDLHVKYSQLVRDFEDNMKEQLRE